MAYPELGLLYKKTALMIKAVFLVSRETLNKYFLDSHFLLINPSSG